MTFPWRLDRSAPITAFCRPGSARAHQTTGRPAQSAATVQPLRNGDSANLVTSLLGLPAVPGSWWHPVLMDPEEQKEMLVIAPDAAGARVHWPAAATAWRLETTTDPALPWTPVTDGITVDGDRFSYLSQEPGDRRYFRLRRG